MTGSWMAAALSADIPAGVVMPVQTPNGPAALWRTRSGRVAACADRCPHRGMRLSHGFVRGETLSCIYHGWSYAESGACTRIPAHPDLTPPKAIHVLTFEVREADSVVWIATGQPEAPPPPLGNLAPLRSLTAWAGRTSVEAAAEDEPALHILLASPEEGQTMIHVLVDSASTPAERIAVSRRAEALRRTAEALERQEHRT